MKLAKHQKEAAAKLRKLLVTEGVAYLRGEIRTGKTFTILQALKDTIVVKPMLPIYWIAPKKSHASIYRDAEAIGFPVHCCNLESVHKLTDKPFAVVIDEAHKIGMWPKPGKHAKTLRQLFERIKFIVLASGTPSPETFVQLYHQFAVTGRGPWYRYPNFYRWADHYVNKKTAYIGFGQTKIDYSEAKEQVLIDFNKYCVTMTQEDAGITSKVEEHFHKLEAPEPIPTFLQSLKKKAVAKFEEETITAETAGKLSVLFHQITSGTVITDSKTAFTLSAYKANFIKDNFSGKKIAIYYYFQQEGHLLRSLFPNSTDSPEVFNGRADTIFICQVKAGKEGVDLSSAEALVMFNVSFSAVDYLQVRGRMQNIKRKTNCPVHWLFSNTGFEESVYDIVANNKKRFTADHFKEFAGGIYVKANRSAIKEVTRKKANVTALPFGFKTK